MRLTAAALFIMLMLFLVQSLLRIASMSLSNVPAESPPSSPPVISSLSLSSSEENFGKKLLHKLSEWDICHRGDTTARPLT